MATTISGTAHVKLKIRVRGKCYTPDLTLGIIANQLTGGGEFSGGMLAGKIQWEIGDDSFISITDIKKELGTQ